MIYITYYASPIGKLVLACKEGVLIGLWMEGQKYFMSNFVDEIEENDNVEPFTKVKEWLERYFNNERPSVKELPLSPQGSEFRKDVWDILCTIPYGETCTYKDIANLIAKRRGVDRMSAQAIGGAVGHNPISIIIPCHRVVGTNGSLTGYAGGIDKKVFLLKHEGVSMKTLYTPQGNDLI